MYRIVTIHHHPIDAAYPFPTSDWGRYAYSVSARPLTQHASAAIPVTHTYTLCIYKLIWMYPVSWRSEVCVSRGKCSIVKVLFPPCWRWRVVLQGRSAHPLINSTHTSASTHTGIFEYTLTPHHLHHYITTTTSYTVPIYSPSRPLTHPSTQS